MTAKAETTYAQRVNKHLPPEVYREKMNNPYRGGTPDFYYEFDRPLWVEFKYIEVPKREDTIIRPNLSPLQLDWLERCHGNGHRPLVVVGSRAGGVALRSPGVWRHGLGAGAFVAEAGTAEEIASIIYQAVLK